LNKEQQINCKVENCAHNDNGRRCKLDQITVTIMPKVEDEERINGSICASFDTK